MMTEHGKQGLKIQKQGRGIINRNSRVELRRLHNV